MGDYSFPCFSLAKVMKKAPNMIAEELKSSLGCIECVEKIENVNGFLNFNISQTELAKAVLYEVDSKKNEFAKSNLGNDKNVTVDYSSPNIAKPFHIGHLRSTVIGKSICNIYSHLGYNVVRINHLGDYGTQFGKLIEGYKLWGDEYNIEENPIDELTKIYVRINNLCKEDDNVLVACQDNFKKLEDKDPYCTEVWEKFRNLSLKEFQKVYDILEVNFDSLNGEAFYSDKMWEVREMLEKSGKLISSNGAKVVDLNHINIEAPCIIEKSNGSTTYATRDLAAILYRARTYDYEKSIYVTSYEQILHFKQVYETAKLLDLDKKYIDGLVHVPFGMVMLKTGKMSTREGNIVKLEDLLSESISRVEKIIEEKNPDLEDKKEISKKIGIGAIIFNDLYNSRVKDEIFDWDEILNFNGETGPYLQYIYVRTKSVLKKQENIPNINDIDFSILNDKASKNILSLMYNFSDCIKQAADKYEPYIIARFVMNLAKAYSQFYNENKIIVEDKKIQDARVYLTYAVNTVLEIGANLLGIQMPERM